MWKLFKKKKSKQELQRGEIREKMINGFSVFGNLAISRCLIISLLNFTKRKVTLESCLGLANLSNEQFCFIGKTKCMSVVGILKNPYMITKICLKVIVRDV